MLYFVISVYCAIIYYKTFLLKNKVPPKQLSWKFGAEMVSSKILSMQSIMLCRRCSKVPAKSRNIVKDLKPNYYRDFSKMMECLHQIK